MALWPRCKKKHGVCTLQTPKTLSAHKPNYFGRGSGCMRSIVMSMSVCWSVCLSEWISPELHARSSLFFVHVACVRGSVLFWYVDNRPHRVSPGRGFLSHWQCIYLRNHKRDLYQFLCMLPVSVARSSSDTFTISRIACRRELPIGLSSPLKMHYRPGKGDESAQLRRSMLSTIALWTCI